MEHGTETRKISGKIGFIFAAAGSAVGLGISEVPLSGCKIRRRIFLLVYLILVVTFGLL